MIPDYLYYIWMAYFYRQTGSIIYIFVYYTILGLWICWFYLIYQLNFNWHHSSLVALLYTSDLYLKITIIWR